eukprot:NODE_3424_length_787_cov_577.781421.p1 GENE.NODE_3424_length_787_cov_577.781421~~NODE_3424_length_787_cov_577.781421.p1  ORF type:complete len:216 (-),score=50.35 NODE_3424_length_787_cov_577.781421:139-696(-)
MAASCVFVLSHSGGNGKVAASLPECVEYDPEVTGIPTPREYSKEVPATDPLGSIKAKANVCDACPGCLDVCDDLDCNACRFKRQGPEMKTKAAKKSYTMCEVQRQNAMGNVWLVAHGRVYDASAFVRTHPAGPAPILRRAGKDCTADFDFHSKAARKSVWSTLEVGRVTPCRIKDPARAAMCEVM